MVLYTEKQLIEAYTEYQANASKSKHIKPCSLEEFRLIYEAHWELHYKEGGLDG
tara:strand:+ start:4434 stop:4595 length:162 start_codon:yes stop_codon:yes gene_type:complete